jgi:hypothetical protein
MLSPMSYEDLRRMQQERVDRSLASYRTAQALRDLPPTAPGVVDCQVIEYDFAPREATAHQLGA